MKKIGLLSDTHGYIHPGVFKFFKEVDEIWHAGDIGLMETAERLALFKPLTAVYGNIDNQEIRKVYPEYQIFETAGLKTLMLHIGGYPGNYTPLARRLIEKHRPSLFISGHSHILKAMPDEARKLLHLNPGAAGYQGLHQKITMMRFHILDGSPGNLEVYETERRRI